jgi:hypothetical protein
MSGNSVIKPFEVICPECGQVNIPRGKAMTLALTCSKCHVYFRRGTWSKEVTRFSDKGDPVIPIGTKGKIDGVLYEVLGFAIKKERKYKYKWREYMLFNPYAGYAFLSEYNGSWNFIWPIEVDPRAGLAIDTFSYKSRRFQLFQDYHANVVYAKGEFLFDVVDITDSTLTYEYIAPPFLVGYESSGDSLLWFEGEYITREELATAFKIPVEKFPKKDGLSYTEPVAGSFSQEGLILVSVILALIAFVIQLFIGAGADEKLVFNQTYVDADFKDQKMVSSASFQMEGSSKSVEINLRAPLNNDWLYADFALINEEDGSEYNFSKEIEYYSGYEDGYAWSEGSKHGTAYLSKIPGGRYHVNIYPEFSYNNKEISISIVRDVPEWTNFIVVILVLAIYPAYYFTRRYFLEIRRWSDSDYSPYDYDA